MANQIADFLDRILFSSHVEQDVSPEIQRIRRRLAIDLGLHSADETGEVSANDIAAYANGSLEERKRLALEDRMSADPEFSEYVSDTLDFFKAVDADTSCLPANLQAEADAITRQAFGSVDDTHQETISSDTKAEIEAFFRDGKSLSSDVQTALFTDSRLRAEFSRVKEKYRKPIFDMPTIAAAANEILVVRKFNGGVVRITGSNRGNYKRIEFSFETRQNANYPRQFLLEGSDGKLFTTALGAPDSRGQTLLIKNMDNEVDAEFVRILQDPTSSGTFYP